MVLFRSTHIHEWVDASPAQIAPEQTTVAAQAFDVAMASELATKAVDLANTVSHLPFVG